MIITIYSISKISLAYLGPDFYIRMGFEIGIVAVYGIVAFFFGKNQV